MTAARREAVCVVATLLLAGMFVAEAALPGLFRQAVWHARMIMLGAIVKLLLQGFAALQAAGNAARFEAHSPAQRAWRWLAVALVSMLVGQLALAPRQLFGVSPNPWPGVADFFFVLSYLPMALALAGFVRAYEEAGLPMGTPARRARFLAAALAVGGAALVPVLQPLVAADRGAWEMAKALAYPIGDLWLLAYTSLLARVALRFGGRLRRVWLALLCGVAALAVGDIVSAYVGAGWWVALEPLIDGLFVLGYGFLAVATLAQRDLLESEV